MTLHGTQRHVQGGRNFFMCLSRIERHRQDRASRISEQFDLIGEQQVIEGVTLAWGDLIADCLEPAPIPGAEFERVRDGPPRDTNDPSSQSSAVRSKDSRDRQAATNVCWVTSSASVTSPRDLTASEYTRDETSR